MASEQEMMADLAAADSAGDTQLAQRIAQQIKSARQQPQETPRRKMGAAMNRILPGVPTGAEGAEQAIGMGMGMTMPNPLPFVGQFLKGATKAAMEGGRRAMGSMFPKAMEAGESALDPVLRQAPTNPMPALPKILEHVPGVSTPAKIYNFIRGAAEAAPSDAPVNPYPRQVAAAAPPAPAPVPTAAPPAPVPTPAPPPMVAPAAAPATAQSLLPQATAQAAPAIKQAAVNIFEKAGRSAKVVELVKAIDANAGAHLGVNPMDPRFAEALAGMPQQWWEGMANVARANKPSPETVKEAVAFFRDRAAQSMKAAQ